MRSSQTKDLQRTLQESTDTVTQVLEMLTGEGIVADVVRRHPVTAEADNMLGVPLGRPLIHRIALLRGAASARAYVYAESTFVPDRLPEEAQLQLAETGEPIGRVMVAHGFALARRALPRLGHPDPPPAVLLGERAKEVIWARAYLLVLNDVPVFAIREWFFGSVLDSLDRTGPA